VALPFTLKKKYLKAKAKERRIMETQIFHHAQIFIFQKKTSVACAIGPSVSMPSTAFFLPKILLNPSKFGFRRIFGIYFEFSVAENSLKNQYLPPSKSKSYEINSIKSCSSGSFQQHQSHIPIP
jgi:hypothetical protein